MTAILLPLLLLSLPMAEMPRSANWCVVGEQVVIPDGRDGPVTHIEGEYCGVMPYGEKYSTRWAYYLIEPLHPKYGR